MKPGTLKKYNGIAWAIQVWSRVTQKQKTRDQVIATIKNKGWLQLELELKYWAEQAKPPGLQKYAPHPAQDHHERSRLAA